MERPDVECGRETQVTHLQIGQRLDAPVVDATRCYTRMTGNMTLALTVGARGKDEVTVFASNEEANDADQLVGVEKILSCGVSHLT